MAEPTEEELEALAATLGDIADDVAPSESEGDRNCAIDLAAAARVLGYAAAPSPTAATSGSASTDVVPALPPKGSKAANLEKARAAKAEKRQRALADARRGQPWGSCFRCCICGRFLATAEKA